MCVYSYTCTQYVSVRVCVSGLDNKLIHIQAVLGSMLCAGRAPIHLQGFHHCACSGVLLRADFFGKFLSASCV